MTARHPGARNRISHGKTMHALTIVAGIMAFVAVYAYANEPKLYYALAGAAVMAGAIYLANHLQSHHGGNSWTR